MELAIVAEASRGLSETEMDWTKRQRGRVSVEVGFQVPQSLGYADFMTIRCAKYNRI